MKSSNYQSGKKLMGVFMLLVVCFAVVIGGLGYRTLVQGTELQAKAENSRTRSVTVAANRGTIYDRTGSVLAVSVSTDSVAVNPSQVEAENVPEVAEKLAAILELDYDTVYQRLTKSSYFEWIKRKADFDAVADLTVEMEEAKLPGVMLVEETQRYYPKVTLAANLLGFAGIDNQGLEGVEYSYDEILKGVDGSIVTEYDSKNNIVQQAIQEYNQPQDGYNIYLTIDENIQYFAERELDVLMNSETPPKAAAVLAMNPQTGEILAWANRPTYDPNNYQNYAAEYRRNMLITDTYEPGSVFKIVTASAALDSGAASLNDRFYDPGYIQVGSHKIKCWRYYRPHGSQSFAEIIQNSCNPCFVNLVHKMEEKQKGTFYKYIHAFGFGDITGLGLQGEAKGIVINEDRVTTLDLSTMSIGQSIAVTPLQMVTAVSAVANGGTLLTPQIVHHVTDNNGNLIQDYQKKEVRRVISADVAKEVCLMLEAVVTKGTGSRAYVDGYRVGGKSGTAQKPGVGGYQEGKYIASFCAVAPVDDPQVVMLVMIDEPSGELYQGGQVAAPVLQKIMADTLRYLGVISQVTEIDSDKIEVKVEQQTSVPDVSNLTVEEAKKVISVAGLKYDISGSGVYIGSQTPGAYSQVAVGTEILLKTVGSADSETVFAPDLTGKYVREVAEILNAMGLKVKTEGSGIAVEQNPVPGSRIKRGEVITVRFEPEVEPNENDGGAVQFFDEHYDELYSGQNSGQNE
ncbi:MAG: PASTA domain-containing protein [Firmicutes bacterium]|nr:PASTA domain-containing protein [Bacillota bacterium]